MKYGDQDRESSNVEDRRGDTRQGGGIGLPGGGGIRIPMGGGGMSIGTMIIIGIIMLLLGMNPLDLLTGGGNIDMSRVPNMPRMEQPRETGQRSPFEIPGMPRGGAPTEAARPGEDELASRTRKVLADLEDFWTQEFQRHNMRYQPPVLVLFSRATRTACGQGMSQMGPFYCPLDKKVYIDLSFYDELHRRFRAPGDFAQAYVIAHEVGHHVQTLLGVADKVQELKQQYPREANQIQVRMELQADCLAGMWARGVEKARQRLEPGDIEEGLNAAARIGDDMIQKQTQGYVVPESFTHGSSEQRVRWFQVGYQQGSMQACDTFRARQL